MNECVPVRAATHVIVQRSGDVRDCIWQPAWRQEATAGKLRQRKAAPVAQRLIRRSCILLTL